MKRTSPSPPAEEAGQAKRLKDNHQSEVTSAALRPPPSIVQALVQRSEEDAAHEQVAALLQEIEAKQQELSSRLLSIRAQAALRAPGRVDVLAKEAEQKQQEAEALLEAARAREAASVAALAAIQKTQAELSSQREALEREAFTRRNLNKNALKRAQDKDAELQERETALAKAEAELARAKAALQLAAGPPKGGLERQEAAVAAREADVARREAALAAAAAASQHVPLSKQASNGGGAATAGPPPAEPSAVLDQQKYRNAMVLLALAKGRKVERCYVCNEKGEALVVCDVCMKVPIHPLCVDPAWVTEGGYTSCALCKESANSILKEEGLDECKIELLDWVEMEDEKGASFAEVVLLDTFRDDRKRTFLNVYGSVTIPPNATVMHHLMKENRKDVPISSIRPLPSDDGWELPTSEYKQGLKVEVGMRISAEGVDPPYYTWFAGVIMELAPVTAKFMHWPNESPVVIKEEDDEYKLRRLRSWSWKSKSWVVQT